jgi:MFS family permease
MLPRNQSGTQVPSDPPYAKPAYAWFVVAVLLVCYILALLDRQILSLMIQPMRADLKITDTEISLLAGFAFVLFYCTAGVVLGGLADRHNRRNMIIVGMLLWCGATAACGLSRTYGQLFISRMLVGFGEGTLGPCAYSLIADYFAPTQRARATGVYTTGIFMGTGVGMMFGGAAIAATAHVSHVELPFVGPLRGWQLAFLLAAVPGVMVAFVLLFIKEPLRRDRQLLAGTRGSTTAFLRDNARVLLPILTGFSINGLVNYGVTTWIPTMFVRRFGWTGAEIGGLYGLILLSVGSLGVIAGGWWASRSNVEDRASRALRIGKRAFLICIPLLLVAGLAPTALVSLIGVTALAFVVGIPAGLAPVALYEVTPNEFRGFIIALYLLTATLLGLGIGVTLIAGTNDFVFHDDQAIGKSLAIVLVAAAALGAMFLHIAWRQRQAGAIAVGQEPARLHS